MTAPDHADAIQHLAHLLEPIEIAMLTTINSEGRLESRPMAAQKVDHDGYLWFFASRTSHLCASVEGNPQVNVAYAHPGKHRYISVTGRAAVTDDAAKRRELWKASLMEWFPGGVDDPDLILIRVHIEHADYWESPANIVVRLAGFAKTILTGNQEPLDTHGHLEL